MELAWRHDYMEFIMPFMIQTVKDLTSKVDYMQRKQDEKQKKDDDKKNDEILQPLDITGFMNPAMAGAIVPFIPGMGDPNMGNMGGGYNPMNPMMGGMGQNPMMGGHNPMMGGGYGGGYI